jgi:adenosine deaminase
VFLEEEEHGSMSELPLPDLHRHLDGSLRPETVRELAARKGVAMPRDLVFYPGMGLAAALERFRFTLSLLETPGSVKRIASEICEDAAREGVTTLEIRFAPQLHTGASLEAIVDAALEGVSGRAGIILCALYGEPPLVAESLVRAAASRPGVVGIDLAGGPASGQRWGLRDYVPAFAHAAELGIGRTVHAGEGRPPAEIRDAVELLGAQRIGHGTTLLDDRSVVDLVIERGVTIEACPTSNFHTGAVSRVEAHPLARWLALGVRACVNSDNTLLSATNAATELRRALSIEGMTGELLEKAIEFGHAARFARTSS